jgi:pimeloyl-ACP methyl ester carboxylesterase
MIENQGYVSTNDGARLFYEKVGDGPRVLVVLNGYYLIDDFKYLADDRTVAFLDLRNRGRSDYITDDSKLTRGIQQDVDDLETVRQHLGIHSIDLLAHSYAGLVAFLYVNKYPTSVNRIVAIGPMQPYLSKQYPPELQNNDAILQHFFSSARELEKERASMEPREFCRRFWSILHRIYVADQAVVERLHWDRCDLETELNGMKYWMKHLVPSMQSLALTAADFSALRHPALIVHGRKDRSAPYGGGRDWTAMLPNARLLTLAGAAHAPWIEFPEEVLAPIRSFLNGTFPDSAEALN